MNSQHQIAREAWKEITDLADTLEEGIADLNGDTRFERIILSAIERATEGNPKVTCGGKNCGDCYDCLKVNLHFALMAVAAKTAAQPQRDDWEETCRKFGVQPQRSECPACDDTGETTAGEDCGTCEGIGQRSEQQEWTKRQTPLGTWQVEAGNRLVCTVTEAIADSIIVAHNAQTHLNHANQ